MVTLAVYSAEGILTGDIGEYQVNWLNSSSPWQASS